MTSLQLVSVSGSAVEEDDEADGGSCNDASALACTHLRSSPLAINAAMVPLHGCHAIDNIIKHMTATTRVSHLPPRARREPSASM